MSEVINKNKYLDLAGLNMYDTLIKALIAKGDSDLAATIAALDAKIGSLDIEDSDDKSVAEYIANIYSSIADIVDAQDALETKDGELESAINDIIGDLESLGESNTLMTLVAVTNKLNELAASVSKNTEDITNVTGRVTAVEEAVKKLGDLGDGNTLGDLVSNITANTQAIEKLTGEGEGSLKKVADAAANAAQVAADAATVAGEAKTAAEGAVSAAEQASADALAAAADAESAQTAADAAAADALAAAASATAAEGQAAAAAASAATAEGVAGEAKATAEGAAATAGEAKATAESASTVAGEAKATAEGAAAVAGEAKTTAEGAKTTAESASTVAGEAKTTAEGAKTTAEGAVTTANEAQATAGTALTTANEAKASAAAAEAAAEGAAAVAGEAKATAAGAKEVADAAAEVADEANEAAKTNASAIEGLNERLADVEGISNAAEVKYEDGFIKLYDKDGNAIGEGFSAADFVVDGMLESVAFKEVDGVKTNVLVFTFNTDHGSDAVEIDFSKYVDVYHADETSLTLNSDSKTFSVKEVAANKTKLGQKITIAGGPLANNIAESGEVWPSKWTNGTEKFIPEDATMYDIVMNLFCVEKWPVKTNGTSNVSTSGASLTSSMDTPTLTYNGKTANGNSSTVEVGTTVSYEAKSGKSSYTATPHTASGFTYGYADANDDTKDSSDTSKKASFGTVSPVADSVPTLTLSGTVSDTISGTAATATAGTASKSGSVVIALGDNKIKAQGKSITYTGTCSALPVYYGCSNLGNTNNDGTTYPSTAKDEVTLTSTAVNSGSIEINCVGAYKVFVGYTAEVPTTSEGVRAMNANNRLGKGSCGTTDTVYTINNNYMVVAIPTGWDFTIQNDLGQADQRNSFAKSDNTVAVQLPNHTEEVPSTISYDIWSIGWSGGAYKNLIIK